MYEGFFVYSYTEAYTSAYQVGRNIMEKTHYTLVQKNRKRANAPWYIRVRTGSSVKDILLGTDRGKAEVELMKVQLRQKELEASGTPGNPLDALAIAQKRASEPLGSIGGVLERWEAKRRLEGFREQSIATYGRALRNMLGDVPVSSLDEALVARVMDATRNLKGSTRHNYAAALKNLFRFLKRPDLVEAVPSVQPEESEHNWWSRDEMMSIISAVECKSPIRELQFREYLELMATVGSRQGETGLLRWKDLDSNGILTFQGAITKSRKTRRVPLPLALQATLEARRGEPGELIFGAIPRDQQGRYALLRRALKKVGLKGCLHDFRRSVSMILYRKGGNIKDVAELLGHSAQVALKFYQQAKSPEDLRELVEW